MPVECVVIGDKAAIARLEAAPAIISEELYLATAEGSLMLEATAKTIIAPHSKTGVLELATGHFIDHIPLGWQGGLAISQVAPYARAADTGTGLFGPFHRPYVGGFRLPPGFNFAYPQGLAGTYPPWGLGAAPPGSGIPLAPGKPHPGMEGIHFTDGAMALNEFAIRERFNLAGKKIAEKIGGGPPLP